MFQLARTFPKPAQGANPARGFPAPGSGAQETGDFSPAPFDAAWGSDAPTKGVRSWLGGFGRPQGFPAPEGPAQARPRGSVNNVGVAVPYGFNMEVETPYFSRGAAAFVENYGKVFTNPIGAGIVTTHRPQASYGPAGNYEAGAIWWTSQAVPTSVNLQGLVNADALAAVLGPINVLAAVRVA